MNKLAKLVGGLFVLYILVGFTTSAVTLWGLVGHYHTNDNRAPSVEVYTTPLKEHGVISSGVIKIVPDNGSKSLYLKININCSLWKYSLQNGKNTFDPFSSIPQSGLIYDVSRSLCPV